MTSLAHSQIRARVATLFSRATWLRILPIFSWQALKQNRERAVASGLTIVLFSICCVSLYFQLQPVHAHYATVRKGLAVFSTGSPYIAPTRALTIYATPTGAANVGGYQPLSSTPTSGTVNSGGPGNGYTPLVSATPIVQSTYGNYQTDPSPTSTPPGGKSIPTRVPVTPLPVTPTVPVSKPTVGPTPSVNLTPPVSSTPPAGPTPMPATCPAPMSIATATSPVLTPASSIAQEPAVSSVSPIETSEPVPTVTGINPIPPVLTRLSQVTDQAFGTNNVYVPNSWGVQKSRIVRTSNDDLFTAYISAGSGVSDREWHLMRMESGSTWTEMQTGDAGTEPVNILLGIHDEIHLFTWPGTKGVLHHLKSTDLGKTIVDETVAGDWDVSQGYSGAGINVQGDMVLLETGADVPGEFLWAYYDISSGIWSFHKVSLDCRYTYAFIMPGNQHDLTIVAMRDVKREELGYPPSTSNFDYIFNEIKYFYIKDASSADATITQQFTIANEEPQSAADTDITYLTDSYIDTQGRTHILYEDQYKGPYEAIVAEEGVKSVALPKIDSGRKMRITQDGTTGRFYIIATSSDGKSLNVYPAVTGDTNGTQFMDPVRFDIAQYASCDDYDFCHPPTFIMPYSGNALADTIDGVYGNHGKEIYFQIILSNYDSNGAAPQTVIKRK